MLKADLYDHQSTFFGSLRIQDLASFTGQLATDGGDAVGPLNATGSRVGFYDGHSTVSGGGPSACLRQLAAFGWGVPIWGVPFFTVFRECMKYTANTIQAPTFPLTSRPHARLVMPRYFTTPGTFSMHGLRLSRQ